MVRCHVIDTIMGGGKSSAMLRFLAEAGNWNFDNHVMIVVPTLAEVARYKKYLSDDRNCGLGTPHIVKEPEYGKSGSKLDSMKYLLSRKTEYIVTTHATFRNLDEDAAGLIRDGKYTLVMDEVVQPMQQFTEVAPVLIESMLKCGYLVADSNNNGKLCWNKENEYVPNKRDEDYKDFFSAVSSGKAYYVKNMSAVFEIMDFSVFDAFHTMYLMTYMFEGQPLYYYLKHRGVQFTKYSTYRDDLLTDGEFCFAVDHNPIFDKIHDLKSLVRICQNKKMNKVGDDRNALSSSWFEKHRKKNDPDIKSIQNNLNNFRVQNKFRSEQVLWTCVYRFKDMIEVDGYKKSFLAVNAKGTNDYADRTYIAYIANIFMNPMLINMLHLDGNEEERIDQDKYALSEMVQFIWRSAIRKGEPINVYVPSSRMRGLLEKWIEENSIDKT